MGFPNPGVVGQTWTEDGIHWLCTPSGWRIDRGAPAISDRSIGPEKLDITVKSRSLATPPTSPVAGDRYIIATPGAIQTPWENRGGQIAEWTGVAWKYSVPKEGWLAWVSDEQIMLTTNASLAWTAFETLNIPNQFATY